ncbi:unnamed protein product [Orchesella dallaii]|uniref:Uncharacterized protein n=1 Tax=Orchesella dallaii TaxID=48710 RepID=A0ABP1QJ33_9HEXA
MRRSQFFKVLTVLVLVAVGGESSSLRPSPAQLMQLENSTEFTKPDPSSINNLYAEVPNVTTVDPFPGGESNITVAYQEQYRIVQNVFGNRIAFVVSTIPIIILIIIFVMAKLNDRGYIRRLAAHEHHPSMPESQTPSQTPVKSSNSTPNQLCQSNLNNVNNASKKSGGSCKANRLLQLDRTSIIRNNLLLAANRRMGYDLTEDDFSSSDDEQTVVTHNLVRPEYTFTAVGTDLPEDMKSEVDNYNREHQIGYQTSMSQDNDDEAQSLKKSKLDPISEDD